MYRADQPWHADAKLNIMDTVAEHRDDLAVHHDFAGFKAAAEAHAACVHHVQLKAFADLVDVSLPNNGGDLFRLVDGHRKNQSLRHHLRPAMVRSGMMPRIVSGKGSVWRMNTWPWLSQVLVISILATSESRSTGLL